MIRLRSGPLAAWASSWLAGHAAADEVLRAVAGTDGTHRVSGLPDGPDDDAPEPLSELLISWRRSSTDQVRLVLPVPGDVRGVPDHPDFRAAALETGEAVVGGPLALCPVVWDAPSSAPISVTWQAFTVPSAPADDIPLGDAQYELTTAIRDTAGALVDAGVTGTNADVAESLGRARRSGERVNLPPDHPPRAVALVAQAERLRAVLDLALADPVGSATTSHAIAVREAALRPLTTAVRRALLAAYNARPDR